MGNAPESREGRIVQRREYRAIRLLFAGPHVHIKSIAEQRAAAAYGAAHSDGCPYEGPFVDALYSTSIGLLPGSTFKVH